MQKIYLDSAATTRLRPEVVQVMSEVLETNFGNPSSTHAFGREAKSRIESARKAIAKLLHASPAEIIFTSGGTEADNMVLRAAVRDMGVERIITAVTEHHAVLHTVEQLEREYGTEIAYVALDECGNPLPEDLEGLLLRSGKKTLVSLMHINNEIGNMIDVSRIGAICHENKALFHTDAVQSVGHWEWNLKDTPVDFLAAAAHKFHGPKGVGFAFIRKEHQLKPLIFGGEQERGFRAGTEALHNILGMEKALVLAYENLDEERDYIKELKRYFIEQLGSRIPGTRFNGYCGDMERSTYNLVNACLPVSSDKADLLLFQLDLKGIACSRGSACQSGSSQGSHVLNAILSDEDLNKPSLRFSFSKYNTKEEIDYVIGVLSDYVNDNA
ncbi:cysteine desulfurase family protein [Robertkochia aurantiaca]|uniref:cysteine desulfurase family protein n=1 Tax=Robertkochia aurantiaca TaxID=2873700 RepID=UPI001CCD966C|nr:cysteine desulfurase family protein [Robertkochia sp. 3YJGBD-33]